jgi:uncharacterized membrane protein YdjX (TVP38/TMEM64 family)
LLLFIVVATFYFGNLFSIADIQNLKYQLQAYTALHPYLTKIIFCTIYILSVSILIPIATPLTVISGILFGLLEGAILALFSSTIGASICFVFFRLIFRKTEVHNKFKDFDRFSKNFNTYGVLYLFAARMTPILPFFLVNIFMAVTPLQFTRFFLVTLAGMAPMTFAYTYSGTILNDINSYEEMISLRLILILSLVGFLPLFLRFILESVFLKKKNKPLIYEK